MVDWQTPLPGEHATGDGQPIAPEFNTLRGNVAEIRDTTADLVQSILSRLELIEGDTGVPSAPNTLTYVVTDNDVDLTWTAPLNAGSSPVTGYRYGRDGFDANGAGEWSSPLLDATQLQGALSSLAYATIYNVWVAAVNAQGQGPRKTVVVPIPAQVIVPTNLLPASTADTGQDITLYTTEDTGISIANDSTWGSIGSASLAVTTTSAAKGTSGVRPTAMVSATPGETYTLSATVRNVSVPGTQFVITAKWRDASGNAVSESYSQYLKVSVGETKTISYAAVAPTGTGISQVRFLLRFGGAPGAGMFNVDGFSITGPATATAPPVTAPPPPTDVPFTPYVEDAVVNNLLDANVASAQGNDLTVYNENGTGTTVSYDSSWYSQGTKSLRVTVGSGASSDAGRAVLATINGGQRHRFRATVRRGSGTSALQASVSWRGADGASVLREVVGANFTSSVGFTTRVDFRATAPANAVAARFIIRYATTAPTAGSYFNVDDMAIEQVTAEAGLTLVRRNTKPLAGVGSANSVWRQDVSSAPLHPDSDALINWLVTNEVTPYYKGVTTFNVRDFNSTIYIVGNDHPTQHVGFYDGQSKGNTPSELYAASSYQAFYNVPIPTAAVAGGGSDGHIMIYNEDSDVLREYWKFAEHRQQQLYGGVPPQYANAGDFSYRPASEWMSGYRGFSAAWGGKIENFSTSNSQFPGSTGTSAAGLSYVDANVGILEAQAGVINHGLVISLVHPKKSVYSYPAKRTDGPSSDTYAIPEGLRLRMDPTINFDTEYTSLTPIARMIAKALQKYGGIVGDKSGVVEIESENSDPIVRLGQADPWSTLLNGVLASAVMKGFPWSRMQALPFNYGKP